MNEKIKELFSEEKIEYFSALSYTEIEQINPSLISRAKIEPRSILLYLVPYYVGEGKNLSTYATSLDYHTKIADINAKLVSLLSALYPDNSFVGFGDHSPIDERRAAALSGLGVLGDNKLLINEKYGSYVFVAEIISDLPVSELGGSQKREIQYCEHCGKCTAACPTNCLLDASIECLSSITQKKGELSENELEIMQKIDTVWGCDECQRACPHNKSPEKTPIEFFYKDRIELLTSEDIDRLDDRELKSRAFGWRGRKTVKRNLDALKY